MASILVIDDAADARRLIERFLTKAGHTVTAVESADLGMAHLKREKIDLVLLDLDMPGKDGVACLTMIRGDTAIQRLPVFMVTGTALREVVIKVARLGVAGIVLKTGNWAPSLVDRVDKFFATSAVASAPTVPKDPQPVPARPADAVPLGKSAVAPPPSATTPVADTKAPKPGSLSGVAPWPPPTAPVDEGPMTDELALSRLAALTPIITRSELLETMLAETIDVRALRPAVQQVLRLSHGSDSSVQTLAAAIRQDQALSLRLLKMANSTLYAHGDRVDSVIKAVSRIGLAQIHTVVLTVGVLDAFNGVPTRGTFRADWFWEHATACGLLAMRIAESCRRPKDYCDTIFTAGLLHDLGRLLYVEHLPDHYPHVIETAERLDLPLELIETRLLLLNHADITDRLLRHWKFATSMVMPVSCHHLSIGNIKSTAPRAADDIVPLALANRVAHAMLLGTSGNEVLYPIEDFADHLQIPPAKVQEVCRKARDEVTDMRLNMIAHSHATSGTYIDSVRDRLGDVRPLALALRPEVDPISMMVDALNGGIRPESPNLLMLRICHSRDRVAAVRLLDEATAAAQQGDKSRAIIPAMIIGDSKSCLLTDTLVGGRHVRQVTLPRTLHRIIRDMRELALVPSAKP